MAHHPIGFTSPETRLHQKSWLLSCSKPSNRIRALYPRYKGVKSTMVPSERRHVEFLYPNLHEYNTVVIIRSISIQDNGKRSHLYHYHGRHVSACSYKSTDAPAIWMTVAIQYTLLGRTAFVFRTSTFIPTVMSSQCSHMGTCRHVDTDHEWNISAYTWMQLVISSDWVLTCLKQFTDAATDVSFSR